MTTNIKLKLGMTYNPRTGVVFRGKKVAGAKASPKPYVSIRHKDLLNKSKTIRAHVLIWESINGDIPAGYVVDHINGIPYDNRLSNLRCVPTYENHKNRSTPSSNSSGHIGVSFHKATQKWRARISKNKKEWHLGLFDSMEEAIAAWSKAKTKLGYHKNHGRDSIYV